MHPSLDRPHPDCQDVIQQLKDCHTKLWQKYTGGCNDLKFAVDHCLKKEKKRLLNSLNEEVHERRSKQEEIIKEAFGKTMTFSEYLELDKEYLAEVAKKKKTRQD